jgi:hypothetical protein
MKAEQAWQAAIEQLQMEMPKAAFDTWVRDTEMLSYSDGEFTIGADNLYARDWVENRLSSTITRLLTGIMNRTVEVNFIVQDTASETEEEQSNPADVIELEIIKRGLKDFFIDEEKIVVIPGYFLRWVSILGATLAWFVVGFFQAFYWSDLRKNLRNGVDGKPKARDGAIIEACPREITRWIGFSESTFWRHIKNPKSEWFIKRIPQPRSEGEINRQPNRYQLLASMPLTPPDVNALYSWLVDQGIQDHPISALEALLETPSWEVIPYPPAPDTLSDPHYQIAIPRTVQDIVLMACGKVNRETMKQVLSLSEKARQHLIPKNDLIIIPQYFLQHWLPKLGAEKGWLIALLKDRGFISRKTGEQRNTVWVQRGYPELAELLGVKQRTLSWWLSSKSDGDQKKMSDRQKREREMLGLFVKKLATKRFHTEDGKQFDKCQFWVNMDMPLVPHHEDEYACLTELAADFVTSDQTVGDFLRSNGAKRADDTQEDGGKRAIESLLPGGKRADDSLVSKGKRASETLDLEAKRADETVPPIAKRADETVKDKHLYFNHLDAADLKKILEHLKMITSTTTPMGNSEKPSAPVVVVADDTEWDLSEMMRRCQINHGNRKRLLETGVQLDAVISWLLYITSPEGEDLGIGFVVNEILEDPAKGAGGGYDRLVKLSPRELRDLVFNHIQSCGAHITRHHDWNTYMKKSSTSKMRQLADYLGIEI